MHSSRPADSSAAAKRLVATVLGKGRCRRSRSRSARTAAPALGLPALECAGFFPAALVERERERQQSHRSRQHAHLCSCNSGDVFPKGWVEAVPLRPHLRHVRSASRFPGRWIGVPATLWMPLARSTSPHRERRARRRSNAWNWSRMVKQWGAAVAELDRAYRHLVRRGRAEDFTPTGSCWIAARCVGTVGFAPTLRRSSSASRASRQPLDRTLRRHSSISCDRLANGQ